MEKNKNDWYASDEQAEAYARAGTSNEQREEALASIVESEPETNAIEKAGEDSREAFSEELYFFEQGASDPPEFVEEVTPDDLSRESSDSLEFAEEITSIAAEEEDIDPQFLKEMSAEDLKREDENQIPEELQPLAEAAEQDASFAETTDEFADRAEDSNESMFAEPDQASWNADDASGQSAEEDEHQTEFAADLAPAYSGAIKTQNEEEGRHVIKHALGEETPAENRGFGIISLVVAIVSLFLWPAVLGPAAVVLGFIAWGRGNSGTGIASIAIGLISFLTYAILLPMLY